MIIRRRLFAKHNCNKQTTRSSNDVQLPYVEVLRQYARDQLVLHLEAVSGRKDLVLDPELTKPLDRVAGATLLKQHGVDKIFKLELSKPLIGCEKRIYLVHPGVRVMRSIADQINAEKNAGHKRTYTILMVPRKLHVCERVLEQEGVFGYVNIDEYQLDLIPLDKDVLSLELPEFFRSYFLDGDQTWCHTAARALLNLQQVFGLIPNVYGIGRCAQVLTKGSFKGLEDVVKLLPGSCFEKNRSTSMKGRSAGGSSSSSPASRVVLVYFIGGCTFTEITALRFLGRLKGYKFIIATTAIVNATSLIREVVDP